MYRQEQEIRVTAVNLTDAAPATKPKVNETSPILDHSGLVRPKLGDVANFIMAQQKIHPIPSNAIIATKSEDSQCEKIVGYIGVKHWILVGLLVVYSIIGGLVMRELETGAWRDRKILWNQRLTDSERELAQKIAYYYTYNHSCTLVDFNSTNSTLLQSIHKAHEDLEIRADTAFNEWNLVEATLYAFTISTTIGYGTPYPITTGGKIFTMCYAVIGIPLTLVVLEGIGKWLAKTLNMPVNFIRKKLHQRRRRKANLAHMRLATGLARQKVEEDLKRDVKPGDGKMPEQPEPETDDDEAEMPLSLALGSWIFWNLFAALTFYLTETVQFLDAVYFYFISLTTIGLGDIMPQNQRFIGLTFVMIMVGLALMSMFISVLQVKMEKAKEAIREEIEEKIGWDTDTSEEERKAAAEGRVYIRKTSAQKAAAKAKKDGVGGNVGLGIFQSRVQGAKGAGAAGKHRKGVQTVESYIAAVKERHDNRLPKSFWYGDRKRIVDEMGLITE